MENLPDDQYFSHWASQLILLFLFRVFLRVNTRLLAAGFFIFLEKLYGS